MFELKHLSFNSSFPMCRCIILKETIKRNILLDLIIPRYNDIDKNKIVERKSKLSALENFIIKYNKLSSYIFNTDNKVG